MSFPAIFPDITQQRDSVIVINLVNCCTAAVCFSPNVWKFQFIRSSGRKSAQTISIAIADASGLAAD